MLTHFFNAFLAYIIMLAVMQYNWWIFIAILLGKKDDFCLLPNYIQKYGKIFMTSSFQSFAGMFDVVSLHWNMI
jgi:hypothetical protein